MTQQDYTLSKGGHDTPQQGRCALEWVAFIAGEQHSDHPVCVDPVLATFGRNWNDALDDVTRQKLRPYLARMIGTAGDGRSLERSFMCLDWLVRTYTPTWLDLAGLRDEAKALRALPEIIDAQTATAAIPAARTARQKATAAWNAAWDAVGTAAWDAAGTAAWTAAWNAVGTAAWNAAGTAARTAARTAAGDAAGDAVDPTVKELQASAFQLLDRMLPGELIELPEPALVRAREVCGLEALA